MINLSLNFDTAGLVEDLTFILAHKDGSKLGLLTNVTNVTFKNSCQDCPEMSLKIYKYNNGTETPLWNDINMFKLMYVKEIDTYFAIECETVEADDGTYKALTLSRLAEDELSKINVYGLQINTEESIVMPNYDPEHPIVLYRPEPALKDYSLLDLLISFAPHYSIGTVDASIQNLQRTFTFDGKSVLDCFKEIEEELSVMFDYDCGDTSNRVINVHDVLSYCNTCGFRGHYTGTCPSCGGTNITEGFGADTGICISKEVLGTNLTYTRNPEAINNCYHVAGGDDIMTAAIWNCNPNGGYVWSFSDEMKSEMSSGLRTALNTYEALYEDYQTTHQFDVSGLPLTQYNALINKYRALDPEVTVDTITSIVGYSQIIKALYDAIDFGEYLNTSLMPSVANSSPTAADVIDNLEDNIETTPVSILSLSNLSLATASNAVVSYARILSDPLFDIKVVSQQLTLSNNVYTWTGVLSATNYYDKDDTAKTRTLNITIDNDVENYAQNGVMQTLLNRSQGNAQIVNLYSMTSQQLAAALQYYSYQYLSSINDCYVKSVEMLTSINAQDPESDAHAIYTKTTSQLDIIAAELTLRENEVKLVDFVDVNNCMVQLLTNMKTSAMQTMNIQNNLTALQWVELNAFRRESDYSNDNYISTSFRRKFDYTDSNFIADSLSNAELIKRAYEFLLQAEYKIKENNTYSYSINTSLQNLLAINEFSALRSSFQCGNWLRIKDDNGILYKLRLIDYEINFDDLSEISVNFSDISLNTTDMDRMQKFMEKTQGVVGEFGKKNNQDKSNLVNKGSDLTYDYTYSDAYTTGESNQNIEILNSGVQTKFEVLDGEIQSKISSDEAQSMIDQSLDDITLSVNNSSSGHYSTLTLNYDGVAIATSGNITLGGDVIFTSNLTDGQTQISGDNILTGIIQSANFNRALGATFSTAGSSFNLTTGELITPAIHIEGISQSGDEPRRAEFKDVYMESGYIGDSKIITEDGDGFKALDHASNAWKLRTAKMDSTGTRYYTYMTKNKNLIVTNTERGAHGDSNDVTDQSNIGSYKYPWNKGYFNLLRVKHHDVLPEGLDVTLSASDWVQHASGYYTLTMEINGMSGDIYLYIATKNGTNLDLVYKNKIEVDSISTDHVTFLAESIPVDGNGDPVDVEIVLLVEDFIYSAIDEPELNADFDQELNQLSCLWASPRDSSKFITWISDELIIEKYDADNDTWEQVLVVPGQGETPFEPDEFSDIPLVIGSESE